MKHICDVVFEGGGIRGIGLAGAVSALEEQGYSFRRLAGSSAGAIVASLLAAGYTAKEMEHILTHLNFEQFKQRNVFSNLGAAGRMLSVVTQYGMYSARQFEEWLAGLLAAKNVYTFADIGDNLKITASDITEGRLLVLPDDIAKFGVEPKTLSVAAAVRMSMSIPFFYEPYVLKNSAGETHFIVDGGMLSNYPVWVLDDGQKAPTYPIFGLRFQRPKAVHRARQPEFSEYLKQILATLTEAYDEKYMSTVRGDAERTISIPVSALGRQIRSTDFDISQAESRELFKNGHRAAAEFLKGWDFRKWKQGFRD